MYQQRRSCTEGIEERRVASSRNESSQRVMAMHGRATGHAGDIEQMEIHAERTVPLTCVGAVCPKHQSVSGVPYS